VEAHSLLVNYQPPRSHVVKTPLDKTEGGPPKTSDLTFMQVGAAIPGTDGVLHPHIQCFACKNKGHYSNACPKDKEVQLFQVEAHKPEGNVDPMLVMDFTFTSVGAKGMAIPKMWVLLNSQSTISIFCNKDLLAQLYH